MADLSAATAATAVASATDDHDPNDHEDNHATNPPPQEAPPKKKRRQGQKQSQTASEAMTPITADGEKPKKKFYRQRAHCNPLSHNTAFEYPRMPAQMDWSQDHYPGLPVKANKDDDDDGTTGHVAPTVLDIGCGFGGLTVKLATLLPDERILGMEIRAKVTEYVRLRLLALRKEHHEDNSGRDGMYENASVLRTNSMKYLPNYFGKATLRKLFFCFPDPHFKRKNWPRRIVSERLLSEYAYCLKPQGGKLYTITDVKELHEWHVQMCDGHPLFRRIVVWNGDSDNDGEGDVGGDDDVEAVAALKNTQDDPCIAAMYYATEEGQKVARNGGKKYYAVYERIDDSQFENGNEERNKMTAQNFFHPVDEEEEEEQEEKEAPQEEGN